MDVSRRLHRSSSARVPAPGDVLELLKPVTWFPPMWAFGCGVVSSGAPIGTTWRFALAGILLAGPLLCGTSQAINDWFDRHVDAINEPGRPIPSGRISGRWGLVIAGAGSFASLVAAALIGPWVVAASALGLACAWAYSMPPLRLKASAIWGPATVGLTYEGLSWFTGASAVLGAPPPPATLAVLGLYSLGAWGIMTLNDFKAVEGDRRTGIRSLPVLVGVPRAALLACAVMAIPQALVVTLLVSGGHRLIGLVVTVGLLGQLALMRRLLTDPARLAPWYNATGVGLFVLGMMASAVGLCGAAGL